MIQTYRLYTEGWQLAFSFPAKPSLVLIKQKLRWIPIALRTCECVYVSECVYVCARASLCVCVCVYVCVCERARTCLRVYVVMGTPPPPQKKKKTKEKDVRYLQYIRVDDVCTE